MFKEKREQIKTFVEEHKSEIIAGTICVGTVVASGIFAHKIVASNKTINKDVEKLLLNHKDDLSNVLKGRVDWACSEAIDCQIRLDTACQIALNSLQREKDRILFEVDELKNYIANLDHTKTINIFHRIPEKEKMIETLTEQLKQIEFDSDIIRKQVEFLEE